MTRLCVVEEAISPFDRVEVAHGSKFSLSDDGTLTAIFEAGQEKERFVVTKDYVDEDGLATVPDGAVVLGKANGAVWALVPEEAYDE